MTPERLAELHELARAAMIGRANLAGELSECLCAIERLQAFTSGAVQLTLTASGDGDVVLLCSRDGRHVYAAIHVDALQGLESLGDGEYSCEWWRRSLPLDVVLTLEGDE